VKLVALDWLARLPSLTFIEFNVFVAQSNVETQTAVNFQADTSLRDLAKAWRGWPQRYPKNWHRAQYKTARGSAGVGVRGMNLSNTINRTTHINRIKFKYHNHPFAVTSHVRIDLIRIISCNCNSCKLDFFPLRQVTPCGATRVVNHVPLSHEF
jgi:hypothetical protein